jgi:hypothetical protein
MNDVVKTNIKTRLEKALANENLSTNEAASLLNVKAPYLSIIKNPENWGKCGIAVWETILTWVNSGQGIREFAEKHGRVLKPIEVSSVSITEPPKQSPVVVEKKEKAKKEEKFSVNLAEIGWIIGLSEDNKSVETISKELGIYYKIVEKVTSHHKKLTLTEKASEPEHKGTLVSILKEERQSLVEKINAIDFLLKQYILKP